MERPSEHDAPPPVPDNDALRGTRFEFGGRRLYSFAQPRVAERVPGRPLPGIGTVAIGHVSRVVPYGAFVDFLGFRGMIHVSQLLPGQRVERVEDVVQLHDEVQVRVIGVDPERRHINLVLVNKLGAGATAAQMAPAAAPTPPVAGESAPGERATADLSPPTPLASPASVPVSPAAAPAPQTTPASQTMPAPQAVPAAPAAPASPVGEAVVPPAAQTRSAEPAPQPARASAPPVATSMTTSMTTSAAPRAAASVPSKSGKAVKPPARPEPKPAVAQHGARAIRRELADPRHPMSRLLAAAGPSSLRPAAKERAPVDGEVPPGDRPAPAPPEPPRPVHVFGPDPEPEQEQPATLEALAARFGQRREPAAPAKAPKNAAERSRLEREKQAQILAKLREDAARFAK